MGRKSHIKYKAESIIPKKIKQRIRVFWDKYWGIIIALIIGLIVGMFILPKFFQ